jgi:hypothetical protein
MKLLALCAMAAALLGNVAQRPEPPEFGFLDVESEPAAEIAIDGGGTGLWTPQHHLPLLVGHHRMTLLRAGHRPSTYGFTVQPGATTRLTIHLARFPW